MFWDTIIFIWNIIIGIREFMIMLLEIVSCITYVVMALLCFIRNTKNKRTWRLFLYSAIIMLAINVRELIFNKALWGLSIISIVCNLATIYLIYKEIMKMEES